jgi:hypothetical protein
VCEELSAAKEPHRRTLPNSPNTSLITKCRRYCGGYGIGKVSEVFGNVSRGMRTP